MEASVINMEGLDFDSDAVEVLPVCRFRLYEDTDFCYGSGVLLDLDYLLKQAGAVNLGGNRLNTPCPSMHKEWSKGVEATLRHLRTRDLGTPERIYLPGAARPLFSEDEDADGKFQFSCACGKCLTADDTESVVSCMYSLANDKQTSLDWFVENSPAAQHMRKLISKFDERMKIAALNQFPNADVRFYSRAKVTHYPGSFFIDRDDYAIYPSMAPEGYRGEVLLETVQDFQLAAVLHADSDRALLMLPRDCDYSDLLSEDLRDFACRMEGEVSDIRTAAEYYLGSFRGCR